MHSKWFSNDNYFMKNTLKIISSLFITTLLFGCGNNSSTKSDGATSLSFASISPTSGPTAGGTAVTITGTNFTNSTTVLFGSTACASISVSSSSSLTCTTPANAEGAVSITLSDGNDSATEANAFTYGTPAPSFSSINPTGFINSQTTTATITGAGFVSGMTVTIGGSPCSSVVVNSGSSITCTTPTGLGAGSYDVVVTNPSAVSTTGTSAFAFRVAPTLTILRAAGPQGAFQVCQGCHGGNGGLTISNYSTVSARVTPGNPSTSLIWQRMNGMNGALMPQGGPMRPASEIQALEDWILDGAQDN